MHVFSAVLSSGQHWGNSTNDRIFMLLDLLNILFIALLALHSWVHLLEMVACGPSVILRPLCRKVSLHRWHKASLWVSTEHPCELKEWGWEGRSTCAQGRHMRFMWGLWFVRYRWYKTRWTREILHSQCLTSDIKRIVEELPWMCLCVCGKILLEHRLFREDAVSGWAASPAGVCHRCSASPQTVMAIANAISCPQN